MGVKLKGLGTYLPSIRPDGTIDVHHRLDRGLKKQLSRQKLGGRVLNRKNVGKTPDELVALWNGEHPDDPVVE